jgi:hypothetical protein
MKKILLILSWIFALSIHGHSQHKISLDLAAIRNTTKPINGANLSCFYYFNERLTAGIELNRFFPVKKRTKHGITELSALDVELNLHYLFALYQGLKLYPVAGFGHSTEALKTAATGHAEHISSWSAKCGAGILWEFGNWSPHIEYNFAWGGERQQFLLAGVSYEIHIHQVKNVH